MAAFSASRFVWSAMSVMTFITLPMASAWLPSSCIVFFSSWEMALTWPMAATTSPTSSAPWVALPRVASAWTEASEALRATSARWSSSAPGGGGGQHARMLHGRALAGALHLGRKLPGGRGHAVGNAVGAVGNFGDGPLGALMAVRSVTVCSRDTILPWAFFSGTTL
jgi:hypothetical protein